MLPKTVFVARDFIGHRRLLGTLSGYNAESLIDAILETLADTTGEQSRVLVAHVVFRSIYDQEPGFEGMQEDLPDEWRDAFRAADAWRERLLAVPVDQVAAWIRSQRTLIQKEASEEEMVSLALETVGPFGVSEELLERVAGPDRNVHDGEEAHWMVYSPVADILCSSDWAWAVREQVRTLDDAASDA
jgi:hypothetical protein